MSEPREQIESLHQQASTQYLQGEYAAAIATWRRLLEIDPQDERAREGMRLCHMLAQAEPPGKADPAQAQEPAPEPSAGPTAIGMGLGEELDRSLERIDEVLQPSGSTADWMDTPHRPSTAPASAEEDVELEIEAPGLDQQPAADPAGGEPVTPAAAQAEPLFDLSLAEEPQIDRPPVDPEPAVEPGSAPSEPQPQADRGAEGLKIDPSMLGIEEDAGPDPSDPSLSPTQAAAAELKHRTNELMAEAMQCYERGEREEALAVLARLAILDENHEAAKTFAAHIRSEMEHPASAAPVDEFVPTEPAPAPQAAPPAAPAAAPEPLVQGDAIDLPTGGDPIELCEAPPVAETPPPVEDTVIDEQAAELSDTEMVQLEAEAGRARKKPNPLLLAGVGAAVLLVIALVALRLFGGGGSEPTADGTIPASVGPTAGRTALPAKPAPDPDSGSSATPEPAREDLAGLLAEGREAFGRADYAAAILAYNKVVKIDPSNAEANDRLAEAAELYRAEKERLADRSSAIEAFQNGDYRNALRLFYRITPEGSEERAQIQRYMSNGWYNLAIRALASGQCRDAKEHLKEARQLAPDDPDLEFAAGLAEECSRGRPDSYYREVSTLTQRGLDD